MIPEQYVVASLGVFIGFVALTNGISIIWLFRQSRYGYAVFAAVLSGLSVTWIDWLAKMFVLIRFG